MTVPPAPAVAAPDLVPLPAEGNGKPARPRGRALRIVLFTAGIGVLAALAALVGWGPIMENLARINVWFFALVALCGAAQLFFTLGWWSIVGRPHPMSYGELFATYLAGDSINYFTGVGGEPLKAHLLAPKMDVG